MNTKKKGTARELLASNVYARMVARYRGLATDNARIVKLSKESGVGRRTIQRVLQPERHQHDVTLGSIEDLAKALRCEVYELLLEPEDKEDKAE